MSVALCRSGQHCNKHSIVVELNEKSSLCRSLSLCLCDHDDDVTPPVALELKSYTESGDSTGGATEPHHNIQL